MDVYVGQNGAIEAGDKECLPGPGWRRGHSVYRGIVESLGKGFTHQIRKEVQSFATPNILLLQVGK